ncbi:MAG: hypothetical protein ACLTH3_15320 [Lachnospira sp.]
MNRNLKNEEVKKYITIGAVLIILYWALQNLQLIFSVMSKILTLYAFFNRRGHCIYYECANEAD